MSDTKKDSPQFSMAEQFSGLPMESLIGGLPTSAADDKPPTVPDGLSDANDAGLHDAHLAHKPIKP
jgi:hypothetical protein